MFYCPKCLNIYNITKNLKLQSGGSNIDDLIKKILDDEDLDKIKFTEDDLDELNKSQNFKKLNNKQKDYVYNTISEKVEKVEKKNKGSANIQRNMYFICKNCGNSELIKDGTIIISRESSKNFSNENINVKEYLQMNILPRTRQYVCPTDKCESHNNSDKKSAAFMRLPGSYKVRYICESCETTWLVS